MKIFIILLVTMFINSAMAANVKVGIVNIQKVITSIKEGKSVDKTLKKSFASKQKTIKKMEDEIKKLQEKLQKQNKVLSDSAKAGKMEEIQKKVMAARQKMQQFQGEIQKEEANLKRPILEKLKPVIDEISKTAKVDLTFEISTSPVVYAASKVELTDKVIKAYDKKYSK